MLRKHEEYIEFNGKFYHKTYSKCHDCQTELDQNKILVFDNGLFNFGTDNTPTLTKHYIALILLLLQMWLCRF